MKHSGFEPQVTTRSSAQASFYVLTRTHCSSLGDKCTGVYLKAGAAWGIGKCLYLSMLSACACSLAYLRMTVRLNTSEITCSHMYAGIETDLTVQSALTYNPQIPSLIYKNLFI